jgi:indolepyruvate ferredoxin oxidoreductase
LDAQFEGDYQLDFHMSPPALFKAAPGQTPRRAFDLFGRSAERRMERDLIEQYESRVRELLVNLLPTLEVTQRPALLDLLALPLSMRGFGHVKLRNVQAAQQRESWLLHRLLPIQYARPEDKRSTGHWRGIAVVKS